MIYIDDYRNLPVHRASGRDWDLSALLGKNIIIKTTTGSISGVVIAHNSASLTLAYKSQISRSRKQDRCAVISKSHIVAIDMPLD